MQIIFIFLLLLANHTFAQIPKFIELCEGNKADAKKVAKLFHADCFHAYEKIIKNGNVRLDLSCNRSNQCKATDKIESVKSLSEFTHQRKKDLSGNKIKSLPPMKEILS